MVVCPVAIAIGCTKCPVFKICPAKGLLGNYRADADATQPLSPSGKARAKGPRKR
jgi:hypothetical protein